MLLTSPKGILTESCITRITLPWFWHSPVFRLSGKELSLKLHHLKCINSNSVSPVLKIIGKKAVPSELHYCDVNIFTCSGAHCTGTCAESCITWISVILFWRSPIPELIGEELGLKLPVQFITVVAHVSHHKVHLFSTDVDGGCDGWGQLTYTHSKVQRQKWTGRLASTALSKLLFNWKSIRQKNHKLMTK